MKIITISQYGGFPSIAANGGGMLRAGLETKILSNYDRT